MVWIKIVCRDKASVVIQCMEKNEQIFRDLRKLLKYVIEKTDVLRILFTVFQFFYTLLCIEFQIKQKNQIINESRFFQQFNLRHFTTSLF